MREFFFQCLHCEGTSIVCDVPYSVYSCGNVRDSVPRYILSNDFFAFYIPSVLCRIPEWKFKFRTFQIFFLYWLSYIIVNFDLIFLKKSHKRRILLIGHNWQFYLRVRSDERGSFSEYFTVRQKKNWKFICNYFIWYIIAWRLKLTVTVPLIYISKVTGTKLFSKQFQNITKLLSLVMFWNCFENINQRNVNF